VKFEIRGLVHSNHQ